MEDETEVEGDLVVLEDGNAGENLEEDPVIGLMAGGRGTKLGEDHLHICCPKQNKNESLKLAF